ncbi:hypothetical protein ACFPOI_43635 [Nonomuraea angiospora]|uniref:Uncharacterized protein n=1 Tax=Nonomuraea angiospora TaxID=46172 RepID=A0ABR9LW29_9ACTN|nr:hypothetical protein [Nonomuraea angiospora]MBE1584530.1 hypothetical protein [Nonomuraea angiospora]
MLGFRDPVACSGPHGDRAQAGIGFTELSNGFATTDDPTVLQAICDRLGPGVINVFVQRRLSRLPLPFTDTDRDAGYWWETSIPHNVEIIFNRQIRSGPTTEIIGGGPTC